MRATFVNIDVSLDLISLNSEPTSGFQVGNIPNTKEPLLPGQISRLQSLQRLVCAVEVSRMTVMNSTSDVVDPKRPSVGADLVMEGK